MQGDSFPQEMSVGRKVDRQIFEEMAAMLVERSEKARTEGLGHGFTAKMPEPDP